ncbi:MAG: hypothetical protein ACTH0C_06900 [Actinomycetaceae bacterium]
MTNPTTHARVGSAVGEGDAGQAFPVAASADSASRPALPGAALNANSAWAPASAATPIRMEDLSFRRPAGLISGPEAAAVIGGGSAAWIAMRDLVPSRALRTVLKLGILGGGTAWGIARAKAAAPKLPKAFAGARRRPHAPDVNSRAGAIGRVGAYAGVGIASLVLVDALAHGGARFLGRRGIPAPHTLLGLAAGGAAAGVVAAK